MIKKIVKGLVKGLHDDNHIATNVDKIYKIHKYWARKPWYVVDKYIEQYSKKGETVIDPFCGSGVTGCESIFLGRDFLGIDLNPMSILISDGTMSSPNDVDSLIEDFYRIKAKCEKDILSLYTLNSICPVCKTNYIEKHLVCGGKNIGKSAVYCKCKKKGSVLIDSSLKRQELELVKKYWVPHTDMPDKFYKDRFSYKGVSKVTDFYTKRSLSALSFLLDTIKKLNSPNEKLLLLAFTNTTLHCSKLKGENVRPMSVNNYWLPNDVIDENVWLRFEDRMKNIINSRLAFNERKSNLKLGLFQLKLGSALNEDNYRKADYIFTDPPYGEAIQYSELSFVWNAWLKQKYVTKEEVIINPAQNKDAKDFNALLDISLENIYKSLKRGKYFTLCFANKEFNIWRQIIVKCKQLGFQLDNIEAYDTYGTPFNKNWAEFSPKTDLYVTFKKISKSDKYTSINTEISFENVLDDIICVLSKKETVSDIYKMYDLTIATIIWLMFYNKKSFNIEDFNLKTFARLINQKVC